MDDRTLIDLAKRGAGNERMTDAALARKLGIQRGTFRTMQVRGYSDRVAVQLARWAGADMAGVIARARGLRARQSKRLAPEVKAALELIAVRSWSTADQTKAAGLQRRSTDLEAA